jgi:xylose isomerase
MQTFLTVTAVIAYSYRHTFRGDGSDPFGAATKEWPWEDATADAMTLATRRMEALFEMMHKLSLDLWCFHDRDIAPEGATLRESNANLDAIADLAAELQDGVWIAQAKRAPSAPSPPYSNPVVTPATGVFLSLIRSLTAFRSRALSDSLERSIMRAVYVAGTNIRPLWGTAQLFKHPRFMNGAATSPQVSRLFPRCCMHETHT